MKKIFVIILAVLLIVSLAGCSAEKGETFTSGGRFTVVEHNNDSISNLDNYILVDNETGVLYIIVYASYRMSMTVLLNADGTPMTVEGIK